jgi:sugar phosphate isomerase/epimerase
MLLDRGMMGDGVIDLRRIRGMVETAGYDGPVEVEIFSAADWWRRPVAETLGVCAERLQSVC